MQVKSRGSVQEAKQIKEAQSTKEQSAEIVILNMSDISELPVHLTPSPEQVS